MNQGWRSIVPIQDLGQHGPCTYPILDPKILPKFARWKSFTQLSKIHYDTQRANELFVESFLKKWSNPQFHPSLRDVTDNSTLNHKLSTMIWAIRSPYANLLTFLATFKTYFHSNNMQYPLVLWLLNRWISKVYVFVIWFWPKVICMGNEAAYLHISLHLVWSKSSFTVAGEPMLSQCCLPYHKSQ